ncbi:MAG: protein phosphatase 2C domain-containing protein [Candidatus Aminicenantes bacterium]|nr:protein phosphatase 2C domain-containing protein [Candidatus Aminicenantes bacterium]
MRLEIEAFGRTDIGRKRDHNEDDFLCLDLRGRSAGSDYDWLLAVADGIGGHVGGAQASAAAVRVLKEAFTPDGAAGSPRDVLFAACRAANAEIFRTAAGIPGSAGMGTTLVAALIRPDRAFIANVGDSRAYVVRDRTLYQLTKDHSWIAEQRAIGDLSEADIERSPFRRMVTRSLGYEDKVQVDGFEVDLESGDALLLCSDGLYGPVPERVMGRVFRKSADLPWICERLVRLANRRGGPDNITAVAARVRPTGRPRKAVRERGEG